MKKKIYEYLVEALLIVFSVILALILNEYRNSLQEEEELNIVLSNVKAEIKSNKSIVEELIPYHRKGIDRLESTLLDNSAIDSLKSKYGLDHFKLFPRGFYPTPLSTSAWEVLMSSGMIAKIGFEKAQLLSRLYSQQELALMPLNDIYHLINERAYLLPERAEENLVLMGRNMKELYGRENSLSTFYDEALKTLE